MTRLEEVHEDLKKCGIMEAKFWKQRSEKIIPDMTYLSEEKEGYSQTKNEVEKTRE